MTARPSLRANVIANYGAKGAMAVLGLVFPPLYARILGIESWALVGFFAVLSMVLGLLDLGLGTTLNRELARLSGDPGEASDRETRDLIASFERLYWTIACTMAVAIALAAPLIAAHWFNDAKLPASTITHSIRLMGAVFALQWPGGVYEGAMLGLQRQVQLNAIQLVCGLVRVLGAALVVWFVSRTIVAFFSWQVAAYALQTFWTRGALKQSLPGSRFGRYTRALILKNWRFSTGMMGVSVVAIVLTQMDKIVVSKTLSMSEFGYYTLAATAGNSLYYLIGPLFAAVFPRFSQLVAQGDETGMARLYHRSAQIMAVLTLPTAVILVLFAPELMLAWTGNAETAAHTWRVATLLAVGTALNGLLNVPYAAQLANGWTKLSFVSNAVGIVVLVPLVLVLAARYGAPGAAMGWALLNAGYFLVTIRVMHRRILRGEQTRWYLRDCLLPFLGAVAGAAPVRLLFRGTFNRWEMMAITGIGIAMATCGAVLATSEIRAEALATWSRLRARRARS